MYYVIGDVHGRYKELMKLTRQLPDDAQLIFVGDLIDRGPDSAKVVKFVRENNHLCVRGNHEQFMIAEGLIDGKAPTRWYESFEKWYGEFGGDKTLQSYGIGENYQDIVLAQESPELIQFYDDIEWMKSLPHVIELDDCIINGRKTVISHSCVWPLWDSRTNNEAVFEEYVRENRQMSEDIEGVFNIYGHQYKKHLLITKYSACIDTSAAGSLAAIQIPSYATYSVENIRDYGKIYLSYQEKGSDMYMTYDGIVLDYEDNCIGKYREEELEEIIALADSLSHDDFYLDAKQDGPFSIVTVYNDDKTHYIKCHECLITNSQYNKLINLLKKFIP